MPKKTPTKKQADEPEEQTKDETLESVLKDFNASWDYCHGSWHDRWLNNFRLYNNERVNVGYEGITNTFVPMTFSTCQTLVSALFGTKPKFQFLPPHNKADQKTDILNALLDYYWEKDQWGIKVINTGTSMIMLGTGIDYFYWNGDHPCMLNVPLRDFFIDPMATSLENARYMGRRYLTTIEDLESFEVIDIDKKDKDGNLTGEMKPKYNIPDDWEHQAPQSGAGSNDEKTDKQEKDMFYGSTLTEPEKKQVEVIEYWTKDKTISILNRKAIIEDSENYYKAKARANGEEYPEGIMPFASARDYVDSSLFYAKGEVDFIADQQELLNDITNQNIDAVTYVLNPMYTLDPKYKDRMQEVENLPGAVYPFEAGALQRIEMGTVPTAAFNERMNIKTEIRETTASNEVIKGVGQTGGDITATEIQAQIAGAGQRINLKVTQIENEYFHRIARIVHAMVKLYVTEPMMVRILGKDGAKWEKFDPKQYQDEYDPRVQLDIEVQAKKQEQANTAKELLGAFAGDPDVNQQELKKLVLARAFNLDPDEVQTLLTHAPQAPVSPPEAPMPAMPPMPLEDQMLGMPSMTPMGGAQPYQDPVSGELIPAEAMQAVA